MIKGEEVSFRAVTEYKPEGTVAGWGVHPVQSPRHTPHTAAPPDVALLARGRQASDAE